MKKLIAFSILKEHSSFAGVETSSKFKAHMSEQEFTKFQAQAFTGCLEFSLHDLGAPPSKLSEYKKLWPKVD